MRLCPWNVTLASVSEDFLSSLVDTVGWGSWIWKKNSYFQVGYNPWRTDFCSGEYYKHVSQQLLLPFPCYSHERSDSWIFSVSPGGILGVKTHQIVGVHLHCSAQDFLIYISAAIHQNFILSVPASLWFQLFLFQVSWSLLWLWICLPLQISRW